MAKSPPAAKGIVAQIQELRRRVDVLAAQVVRPEAARSAYDRAARGVIARQVLDASSVAFASPSNSDFVLASIVSDGTRSFFVGLKTQLVASALSNWNVFLTADPGTGAVGVDRFWREPSPGGQAHTCATRVLWEPAAGTYTLRVRQAIDPVAGGAGTLTYAANNATDDTAARRTFWVEDAGLRPA